MLHSKNKKKEMGLTKIEMDVVDCAKICSSKAVIVFITFEK